MLDITAANSVNIQKPAKTAPKTWRTRKEAMNAAVAEIGPHARHEFEFSTHRCDGRWLWKAADSVKPPTGAELKNMGGKRAFLKGSGSTAGDALADSSALNGSAPPCSILQSFAAQTQTKPSEPKSKPRLSLTMAANALGGSLDSLKVGAMSDGVQPRECATELPTGVAARATVKDAVKAAVAAGLSPKGFRKVAEAVADELTTQEAGQAVNTAALAAHEERGRERAEAEGRAYPTPKGDGLGIPEFLKRKDSPAHRAKIAKIVEETNPRTRKIKNPPDAKAAKSKTETKKKAGGGSKSKAEIIRDLLTRKEGATQQQLKEATGYRYVNVNAMAEQTGKKVVKKGEVFWLR